MDMVASPQGSEFGVLGSGSEERVQGSGFGFGKYMRTGTIILDLLPHGESGQRLKFLGNCFFPEP